jgi:phospholipid N-methyltransferase
MEGKTRKVKGVIRPSSPYMTDTMRRLIKGGSYVFMSILSFFHTTGLITVAVLKRGVASEVRMF